MASAAAVVGAFAAAAAAAAGVAAAGVVAAVTAGAAADGEAASTASAAGALGGGHLRHFAHHFFHLGLELPSGEQDHQAVHGAGHACLELPKKRAVLELPQRYFCRLFVGRATRRCLKPHDLPVLLLNGIVFRPPLPRIGENNVQRTV